MSKEVIDELLSSQISTRTTQRGPALGQIAAMQAQASRSQQDFDYKEAHYLKNNEGYFLTYYYTGWKAYEDFSYENPSFQSQEGSSFNYHGQIWQPSFKE